MNSSQIKVKHKYLLRCYGITYEEFINILNLQNNSCAICAKVLIIGQIRIEVDHDHKITRGKKDMATKRKSIRGLLCGGHRGCNKRLGRVDEAKWLAGAYKYIIDPPAQKVLNSNQVYEKIIQI